MSDIKVGAEVAGLGDVLYRISKLSNIEINRDVRESLAEASKVLVKGARVRLSQRLLGRGRQTGNLMRSITFRVKRNNLGAIVGFNDQGKHAHLVDRGTQERWTRYRRYRGKMPANRFFEDTKIIDAPRALEALQRGLDRALKNVTR